MAVRNALIPAALVVLLLSPFACVNRWGGDGGGSDDADDPNEPVGAYDYSSWWQWNLSAADPATSPETVGFFGEITFSGSSVSGTITHAGLDGGGAVVMNYDYNISSGSYDTSDVGVYIVGTSTANLNRGSCTPSGGLTNQSTWDGYMNEFETMQFIPADALPAAWSIDGEPVQQTISDVEAELAATTHCVVAAQVPSLLSPTPS